MSLFDGLINWWGLGDYGTGTLFDYGPSGHNGTWQAFAGYGQGGGGSAVSKCKKDGASFESFGWNRTNGHGGGSVPYPLGSAWYDPLSWSFNIWVKTFLPIGSGKPCPGVPTDFPVQPWGTGHYFPCDRVSSGLKTWNCVAEYVSDGSKLPQDDPAHWEEDLYWDGTCYGAASLPYNRMGVVGDHSGFPFNAGWMIYVDDPLNTLGPCGASGWAPAAWVYRFECESNGLHPPISLAFGDASYNVWDMLTLTSDGTTLLLYRNGAVVGVADATHLVTSNASLGFGYADLNKALSGRFEQLQGNIDEALLWNRPLTYAEVQELYGDQWCEPKYSLSTVHRAEPSSNPGGSKTEIPPPRHLSGVRFRSDNGSASAGANKGDFSEKGSLAPVHFRSKV